MAEQETIVDKNNVELSQAERARIEENRQRALELRKRRQNSSVTIKFVHQHPFITKNWLFEYPEFLFSKTSTPVFESKKPPVRNKLIDTGGGFLLEEKEVEAERSKKVNYVVL